MKISINFDYLAISIDQSSPNELLAVRRLSDAYFNSALQAWIIPIRLGLSDVLLEHYIFWQLEPLTRPLEEALYQQTQLRGSSINIWTMPAYAAVAQAALNHLQTVHFGNITVYNENHENYKELQNENTKSRRPKNQVCASSNASPKTSNKGKRLSNEARRRALLDR